MEMADPSLFISSDKRANGDKKSFFKAAAAFGLGVISASAFFMPFAAVTAGGMKYTLTGMDAAFSRLDVNGGIMPLPPVMRISALLPPFLSLAGMLLLRAKKYRAGAAAFALSALCPMLFTVCSPALEASVGQYLTGTVSLESRAGYSLTMILSAVCAVLSLWARGAEQLGEALFKISAMIAVGIAAAVMLYITVQGTPALAKIGVLKFLFGTEWSPSADVPQFGIFKMILATLVGTAGAVALGVPVGVLTAVFLSEFAPRPAAAVIKPAAELLAGIPSVVYGLFGIKIIVPAIRRLFPDDTTGEGLLAVIIILGIMILPTIISMTSSSLAAVDPALREASLAVGATQVRTVFGVQLPAARSGVVSGIILGVGRAVGETMAVIMVAGNTVWFGGLLEPVRPLTVGFVFEMGYASGLHRQALYSVGLVLFVFIMIINISFGAVKRGSAKEARS